MKGKSYKKKIKGENRRKIVKKKCRKMKEKS